MSGPLVTLLAPSSDRVSNNPQNAGQMAQRFFIAKTQHFQPSSFEFHTALSVIRSSLGRIMDAAVKLNHQAGFSTVKIDNVPIKSLLTQETQPLESRSAQSFPQNCLGRRWIFAVLPLQLEQIKRFFHGTHLNDSSGWRLGHSHPAADAAALSRLYEREQLQLPFGTRLPSLAGERSAQARKVLLSGQDRVGDESGVPSSVPAEGECP